MSLTSIADLEIMRDLLKMLYGMSKKHWDAGIDLSKKPLKLGAVNSHNELQGERPKMKKEKLNDLLGKTKKKLSFYGEHTYYYLPPLEDNQQFVPVLSIEYDLQKSPPEVELYITMFSYFESEKKIKGIGFRFEKGEHASKHDYFHVQLITELYGELGCPVWIPEKTPCIPTIGQCPVSLFISMLISFYGKQNYKKMLATCLHNYINHEARLKEIMKTVEHSLICA